MKPAPKSIRDFMMPAGVGALVALLSVLAGGDLGTGLIFMMFTAGMVWLADIPWKYLGTLALAVSVWRCLFCTKLASWPFLHSTSRISLADLIQWSQPSRTTPCGPSAPVDLVDLV